MNREELFEVIGEIDESHVKAAREPRRKKPVWKRRWVQAVAAVLVVVIAGGILLRPGEGPLVTSAYAIAEARYPEMAPYPQEDGLLYEKKYDAWRKDVQKQQRPEGYADGLEGFFAATIQEFLSGTDGENKVYSPVNVYMALAMLAELTDGNSRQQILDLLGYENMDRLRTQASDVWNANYIQDGVSSRVLASSVWLDKDISFVQETMDTLAEVYYASSYQGEMGSDEFNKALWDWLNAQTGGLLEEQAGQIEMSPDTILALAATLYFRAGWYDEFSKGKTEPNVFHTPGGDVTCDFMHNDGMKGTYFWGDNFSAVAQGFEKIGGSMWFILPDEGVTVDELLSDEETLEFILAGSEWENGERKRINLVVPKFDVTSRMDLVEGLKALGVTDVFDWTVSDFSPMTKDTDEVFVSKVRHDARVVIDEEGCTAAAYTVILAVTGDAPPPDEEIDFVVDRPFLFVITGADNVPLFVGVVNDP